MTILAPLSGILSPLGVAAGRRRGIESNYCLGFDGVSAQVTITDPSQLSFSTGDFTVCYWIRVDSKAAIYNPLRKNGTVFSNYEHQSVVSGSNNYLELYVHDGSYKAVNTSQLSLSLWHQVVQVRSGATLIAYTDGRETDRRTDIGATLTSGSGDLTLGYDSTVPGQYLRGAMDDVRIYSRVLTAAEVQGIYRNSSPPPTSGLVGHWAFEEGTGASAADSSGNGNTGTLTGGPTWQPQTPPRLIASRNTETWAVLFDGANDSIDTALNWSSLGSAATLSLWFKINAAGNYMLAASSDFNSNYLYLSGGTAIVWNDGANEFNKAFVPVVDRWYHVAATKSGNVGEVWIDGVSLGTGTLTAGSFSSGLFRMGGRNGTTFPLNGIEKDVRLYSSALSAASIRLLAQGKEPADTPVARWRLNEGTGTTASDSIGSNHGTLTNGPTWTGDVPQHFRQTIESSQSLSLDGVDDYVTLGAGTFLDSGLVNHCVSFWFYLGVDTDGYLLSKESNTIYPFEVFYDAVENAINWDGGGAASQIQSGALVLNRWYHCTVIGTASSKTLYIDGVLVASSVSSGSIIADTDYDFTCGRRGDGNLKFNGRIDELGIFNRAATAAEIADQAAGYLVSAGLVSRYKLDGNAQDAVGSNHGTEQGGVGYSASVPGTL